MRSKKTYRKPNKGIRGYSTLEIFIQNRFLQVLLSCVTLLWLLAAISPYDRFDWLLENLLVFIFMGVLIILYPSFRFSNTSYFLIALFISFHIIGANYSYTETPLDAYIKEMFNLKRDHYDRIVHFMFGLLISYPLIEALIKVVGVRRFWAGVFAVSIIMAASSVYELIEMWVAKIVSPELGTLFLGTQGDQWDTQNDMAMAFYGSLIAVFITMSITNFTKGLTNKNKYIGFGG